MSGVLLTGATGLVGQAALVRLLADDPRTVVHCLVRADDDATPCGARATS